MVVIRSGQGYMHIQIKHGRDLRPMDDWSKKSDPFCEYWFNTNINEDSVIYSNNDSDFFDITIVNLEPTKYGFVRAFAINSAGIGYGSPKIPYAFPCTGNP